MRIIKITLSALIIAGLTSCTENHEGYVPESDYQEIVKEYKKLKADYEDGLKKLEISMKKWTDNA